MTNDLSQEPSPKLSRALIGGAVLLAAAAAIWWYFIGPTPLERAKRASDAGKPGAAAEILLKRLEVPGLLPEEELPLRRELARALLAKGSYDAAEEALHTLEEKFPRDPYAALGMGFLFFSRGEDAFAVDSFKKAKALAPEDPSASRSLLRLYNFRGEYDGAREEALSLLNRDPRDGEARRQLGAAELGRGLFSDAAQAFGDILQSSPDDQGTRRLLTWSLLGAGEFRRAEESLAALLKAGPEDPFNLALQAAYFRIRSYPDQSAALLRRVYENDPRRLFAGVALAADLARRRETDKAQALLLDIAHRLPNKEDIAPPSAANFYEPWQVLELRRDLRDLRAEFHLAMAETYKSRYLLDDVERQVRLALQLSPRDVAALRALTEFRRAAGDGKGRLEAARAAAALFPQHPDILLDLSQALVAAKRPREALTFAQAAAAACPALARAQSVLAEAHLALGEKSPAAAAAKKALELNDRDPFSSLVAGLSKAEAADWRGAEKDLSRSLELDGSLARTHWELSRVWEKLRNKREAGLHRDKALELEPRVYAR